MDEIQKVLIGQGRRDLAQKYYRKISAMEVEDVYFKSGIIVDKYGQPIYDIGYKTFKNIEEAQQYIDNILDPDIELKGDWKDKSKVLTKNKNVKKTADNILKKSVNINDGGLPEDIEALFARLNIDNVKKIDNVNNLYEITVNETEFTDEQMDLIVNSYRFEILENGNNGIILKFRA